MLSFAAIVSMCLVGAVPDAAVAAELGVSLVQDTGLVVSDDAAPPVASTIHGMSETLVKGSVAMCVRFDEPLTPADATAGRILFSSAQAGSAPQQCMQLRAVPVFDNDNAYTGFHMDLEHPVNSGPFAARSELIPTQLDNGEFHSIVFQYVVKSTRVESYVYMDGDTDPYNLWGNPSCNFCAFVSSWGCTDCKQICTDHVRIAGDATTVNADDAFHGMVKLAYLKNDSVATSTDTSAITDFHESCISSPSATPSVSASPSATPSVSASQSATLSASASQSESLSASASQSETLSASLSSSTSTTISPSPSWSASNLQSTSASMTTSSSESAPPSLSATQSISSTPSRSTPPSALPSPSTTSSTLISAEGSVSPSSTHSVSQSESSPSMSPTESSSITKSTSKSATITVSPSHTPSNSLSPSHTSSMSLSPTSTSSSSSSPSRPPSSTTSPSESPSQSPSSSVSATPSITPSQSLGLERVEIVTTMTIQFANISSDALASQLQDVIAAFKSAVATAAAVPPGLVEVSVKTQKNKNDADGAELQLEAILRVPATDNSTVVEELTTAASIPATDSNSLIGLFNARLSLSNIQEASSVEIQSLESRAMPSPSPSPSQSSGDDGEGKDNSIFIYVVGGAAGGATLCLCGCLCSYKRRRSGKSESKRHLKRRFSGERVATSTRVDADTKSKRGSPSPGSSRKSGTRKNSGRKAKTHTVVPF